MDKKSVVKGIILGIAAPMLVAVLFIALMINTDIAAGIRRLESMEQLGNVIRLGLLANLVCFMFVIRRNEALARGIVIPTLILLIVSIIV